MVAECFYEWTDSSNVLNDTPVELVVALCGETAHPRFCLNLACCHVFSLSLLESIKKTSHWYRLQPGDRGILPVKRKSVMAQP
jgi:hypothetical protein